MPIATATCMALGELLTHGYDVARALARPWPITPAEASLVIAGVAPILPRFVEERAARGVRASYEVRLRGGPHLVLRFHDAALTVHRTIDAGPVDVHIAADPAAFLLVAYGRISQWGPILKGQMLAWGRKPWLAFMLKRLPESWREKVMHGNAAALYGERLGLVAA